MHLNTFTWLPLALPSFGALLSQARGPLLLPSSFSHSWHMVPSCCHHLFPTCWRCVFEMELAGPVRSYQMGGKGLGICLTRWEEGGWWSSVSTIRVLKRRWDGLWTAAVTTKMLYSRIFCQTQKSTDVSPLAGCKDWLREPCSASSR